jgi:uncharacterized protein YoxC
MDTVLVAWVAGAMAVIGFVTVWIKVGINKGQSDNRLEVVEDRTTKLEEDVEAIQAERHVFELEIVKAITELGTKIEFILRGIDEIKKRQEADRAEKE